MFMIYSPLQIGYGYVVLSNVPLDSRHGIWIHKGTGGYVVWRKREKVRDEVDKRGEPGQVVMETASEG